VARPTLAAVADHLARAGRARRGSRSGSRRERGARPGGRRARQTSDRCPPSGRAESARSSGRSPILRPPCSRSCGHTGSTRRTPTSCRVGGHRTRAVTSGARAGGSPLGAPAPSAAPQRTSAYRLKYSARASQAESRRGRLPSRRRGGRDDGARARRGCDAVLGDEAHLELAAPVRIRLARSYMRPPAEVALEMRAHRVADLGRDRRRGVVIEVDHSAVSAPAWSRGSSSPWRRISRPCGGCPHRPIARRCRRGRPG
jgi:hypothetical protein